MTVNRTLIIYGIVLLLIGLPFTAIHLRAQPDDAPISPLQRTVASLANFAGPWDVAVVRIVNFPNAGMRSFRWAWALGLTLLGALLIATPLLIKRRWVQCPCAVAWFGFLVVWFGIGLRQIASGLL